MQEISSFKNSLLKYIDLILNPNSTEDGIKEAKNALQRIFLTQYFTEISSYISNLKPCDKYSEDDINDLKKALINSESFFQSPIPLFYQQARLFDLLISKIFRKRIEIGFELFKTKIFQNRRFFKFSKVLISTIQRMKNNREKNSFFVLKNIANLKKKKMEKNVNVLIEILEKNQLKLIKEFFLRFLSKKKENFIKKILSLWKRNLNFLKREYILKWRENININKGKKKKASERLKAKLLILFAKQESSLNVQQAFFRWKIRTDKKLIKYSLDRFALTSKISLLTVYWRFKSLLEIPNEIKKNKKYSLHLLKILILISNKLKDRQRIAFERVLRFNNNFGLKNEENKKKLPLILLKILKNKQDKLIFFFLKDLKDILLLEKFKKLSQKSNIIQKLISTLNLKTSKAFYHWLLFIPVKNQESNILKNLAEKFIKNKKNKILSLFSLWKNKIKINKNTDKNLLLAERIKTIILKRIFFIDKILINEKKIGENTKNKLISTFIFKIHNNLRDNLKKWNLNSQEITLQKKRLQIINFCEILDTNMQNILNPFFQKTKFEEKYQSIIKKIIFSNRNKLYQAFIKWNNFNKSTQILLSNKGNYIIKLNRILKNTEFSFILLKFYDFAKRNHKISKGFFFIKKIFNQKMNLPFYKIKKIENEKNDSLKKSRFLTNNISKLLEKKIKQTFFELKNSEKIIKKLQTDLFSNFKLKTNLNLKSSFENWKNFYLINKNNEKSNLILGIFILLEEIISKNNEILLEKPENNIKILEKLTNIFQIKINKNLFDFFNCLKINDIYEKKLKNKKKSNLTKLLNDILKERIKTTFLILSKNLEKTDFLKEKIILKIINSQIKIQENSFKKWKIETDLYKEIEKTKKIAEIFELIQSKINLQLNLFFKNDFNSINQRIKFQEIKKLNEFLNPNKYIKEILKRFQENSKNMKIKKFNPLVQLINQLNYQVKKPIFKTYEILKQENNISDNLKSNLFSFFISTNKNSLNSAFSNWKSKTIFLKLKSQDSLIINFIINLQEICQKNLEFLFENRKNEKKDKYYHLFNCLNKIQSNLIKKSFQKIFVKNSNSLKKKLFTNFIQKISQKLKFFIMKWNYLSKFDKKIILSKKIVNFFMLTNEIISENNNLLLKNTNFKFNQEKILNILFKSQLNYLKEAFYLWLGQTKIWKVGLINPDREIIYIKSIENYLKNQENFDLKFVLAKFYQNKRISFVNDKKSKIFDFSIIQIILNKIKKNSFEHFFDENEKGKFLKKKNMIKLIKNTQVLINSVFINWKIIVNNEKTSLKSSKIILFFESLNTTLENNLQFLFQVENSLQNQRKKHIIYLLISHQKQIMREVLYLWNGSQKLYSFIKLSKTNNRGQILIFSIEKILLNNIKKTFYSLNSKNYQNKNNIIRKLIKNTNEKIRDFLKKWNFNSKLQSEIQLISSQDKFLINCMQENFASEKLINQITKLSIPDLRNTFLIFIFENELAKNKKNEIYKRIIQISLEKLRNKLNIWKFNTKIKFEIENINIQDKFLINCMQENFALEKLTIQIKNLIFPDLRTTMNNFKIYEEKSKYKKKEICQKICKIIIFKQEKYFNFWKNNCKFNNEIHSIISQDKFLINCMQENFASEKLIYLIKNLNSPIKKSYDILKREYLESNNKKTNILRLIIDKTMEKLKNSLFLWRYNILNSSDHEKKEKLLKNSLKNYSKNQLFSSLNCIYTNFLSFSFNKIKSKHTKIKNSLIKSLFLIYNHKLKLAFESIKYWAEIDLVKTYCNSLWKWKLANVEARNYALLGKAYSKGFFLNSLSNILKNLIVKIKLEIFQKLKKKQFLQKFQKFSFFIKKFFWKIFLQKIKKKQNREIKYKRVIRKMCIEIKKKESFYFNKWKILTKNKTKNFYWISLIFDIFVKLKRFSFEKIRKYNNIINCSEYEQNLNFSREKLEKKKLAKFNGNVTKFEKTEILLNMIDEIKLKKINEFFKKIKLFSNKKKEKLQRFFQIITVLLKLTYRDSINKWKSFIKLKNQTLKMKGILTLIWLSSSIEKLRLSDYFNKWKKEKKKNKQNPWFVKAVNIISKQVWLNPQIAYWRLRDFNEKITEKRLNALSKVKIKKMFNCICKLYDNQTSNAFYRLAKLTKNRLADNTYENNDVSKLINMHNCLEYIIKKNLFYALDCLKKDSMTLSTKIQHFMSEKDIKNVKNLGYCFHFYSIITKIFTINNQRMLNSAFNILKKNQFLYIINTISNSDFFYNEQQKMENKLNEKENELNLANECIIILNERLIKNMTKVFVLIIKKYENFNLKDGFKAIKHLKKKKII